jgi:hypothetical protein
MIKTKQTPQMKLFKKMLKKFHYRVIDGEIKCILERGQLVDLFDFLEKEFGKIKK